MIQNNAQRKLLGKSIAIQEFLEEVECAAGSNTRVLISGDASVRKELIARNIHERSARQSHPFLAITCAGLQNDLPSALKRADRGTLFIDEIGELDTRLQNALLSFLETPLPTADVRIMASSSQNLHDAVTNGRFNAALFYRLNVIHIVVPESHEETRDVRSTLDSVQHRFRLEINTSS
jgi:DNA-binding NtrC family response regulator